MTNQKGGSRAPLMTVSRWPSILWRSALWRRCSMCSCSLELLT